MTGRQPVVNDQVTPFDQPQVVQSLAGRTVSCGASKSWGRDLRAHPAAWSGNEHVSFQPKCTRHPLSICRDDDSGPDELVLSKLLHNSFLKYR